MLEMMPAENVADYEDLLSRLKVPTLVDQTIDLLQEGWPRHTAKGALTMADQVAGQIQEGADFAIAKFNLPRQFRAEHCPGSGQDGLTVIKPAMERLVSRDEYARYAVHRPRRATQWFEGRLRSNTTRGIVSPDAPQDRPSALKRIRNDGGIKAKVNEAPACFSVSTVDPQFMRDGRLLAGYRDICKKADPN